MIQGSFSISNFASKARDPGCGARPTTRVYLAERFRIRVR
jgi:hypothetical protein